jgi:hypothetical protein
MKRLLGAAVPEFQLTAGDGKQTAFHSEPRQL